MVRTGHRDPETGARMMRRDAPAMGGFRKLDPDWPLVAALEVFDDDTQAAEPAAIFTERVVAPPAPRGRAESAADAVAICLDESGMVTTERVAELLGVTEDQARAEMGTLVFDHPDTAMLVPAAEYLSGDVRRKLDAAHAAAAMDGGGDLWGTNVAALERVLPRQLEPGEITARLGASWIPAEDVEAFCREVLEASIAVAHLRDLGRWQVKLRVGDRRSVALSSDRPTGGIAKRVGPHTLRHAFITAALDAGVPLREVQEARRRSTGSVRQRRSRGYTMLSRQFPARKMVPCRTPSRSKPTFSSARCSAMFATSVYASSRCAGVVSDRY
jgi:hypothetical protein